MSKVKYYYDTETLSYRKIEPRKGRKLRNVFLFLTASMLFGFIGMFILLNTNFLNTPRELAQARELKQYEIQYELLNKKLAQIEEVLHNIEDRDNNLYRLYFEANPIPEEQRKAGFGGINRYKSLEGYNNSEMIISTTKRLEILQKQLVVQSKSLDEITRLAADKEKLLAAIPAIQPILSKDLTRSPQDMDGEVTRLQKLENFITAWILQLLEALRFMQLVMGWLNARTIQLQDMANTFESIMDMAMLACMHT